MSLPRYSVIIPAYNCEKTLKETVNSAINQTLKPFEIIIIDDCSTDNTYSLILELSKGNSLIVPFQNKKNIGVAETRNFAFTSAQGDYIALLDADDCWEPNKIENQIKLMENTNCDFSYTGYRLIDFAGNDTGKIYNVPVNLSYKQMLVENYIGCSTVVLKKSLTVNYKMNPNYSHEDYVFWLELLKEGKTACGINQPLMKYRVYPTSRSGDKLNAAKNRWLVYRKFLKLNFFSSFIFFVRYALRGLKKHK